MSIHPSAAYLPTARTGVTAVKPDSLHLPASISSISSGSWVLNGSSIMKNSKRAITEYTGLSTESLGEGDRLGVMRKGAELRFFINGADQGVAERELPGVVYVLLDLYGRCVKATIVGGGGGGGGGGECLIGEEREEVCLA